MIRVSMLYLRNEDKTFDIEYYVKHHVALMHEKLDGFGLKSVEVDRGLTGLSHSESPFFAIGYLMFESLETFSAAFDQVGAELLADMSNYTNVDPIVQISEIVPT